MRLISTTLIMLVACFGAIAQFQIRAIDGPNCNQVTIQMKCDNPALIPVHGSDDCFGEPGLGNTICYDLTFTLTWTDASITTLQDVINPACNIDPDDPLYSVVDVGAVLTLGGGVKGRGFSNGGVTPIDVAETWVLNQWMDIVIVNMIGFSCVDEGGGNEGSLSTLIEVNPNGSYGPSTWPNIALNLPDEGVITDYTPVVQDGPLPVSLISFTAKKDGERSSLLTWSTSEEINTNHFVIERSQDRHTWTEAGKVQATGSGAGIETYNFLDHNVYDGRRPIARYFYRLKMVDNDGKTGNSSIQIVLFEKDATVTQILTYPIPATTGVNVEFHYGSEATMVRAIAMFNELGQMVYSQEVGENSLGEYIDFKSANVTSGAYSLQVLDADNNVITTEKIVVQR